MCGRYALAADLATIAQEFSAHLSDVHESHSWEPEYNIAPTTWAPIIVERTQEGAVPERLVAPARWGLLPRWVRDPAGRAPLFNARSETVSEKRSFSESYAHKRCLVPASGYFEWHSDASGKRPFYVHTASLMAMAGIFTWWKKGEDDWWLTFAILTAPAPPEISWLHDRVPVILPESSHDAWLDGTASQATVDQLVTESIGQIDDDIAQHRLVTHEVSKDVGNTRHHGAYLIEQVSRA